MSIRQNQRVMLVDSSEISISRIKRLMSDMKNVEFVGAASSSTEAIAIVKLMKPDVVILDIQLPGKNGIGVLVDIKKNFESVKVIVLTNYTEPHYRNLCLESGSDYFFDKSTEFEKIPEVLVSLS